MGMLITDSISKVLVHELSQEWSDACHQSGCIEEGIKQHIQTAPLLVYSVISSHPVAVESHVPVAQL